MNGTNPPVVTPVNSKTCGMAIAGLVFGILALIPCCFHLAGILGIVFSCIAMSQIKKQPTILTGKGMATAGLVMSIVGLVIYTIIMILYWAVFAARLAAMKH
jgi:hypothetical protein